MCVRQWVWSKIKNNKKTNFPREFLKNFQKIFLKSRGKILKKYSKRMIIMNATISLQNIDNSLLNAIRSVIKLRPEVKCRISKKK